MKVKVQEKPKTFEAEQFLVDQKPWPDGVEEVDKGKYRYRISVATYWMIDDGDWIVHLPSRTEVWTDKSFGQHYIVL